MSKALVNALTLALIYDGKSPEDAKQFAESFVEDNAELIGVQVITPVEHRPQQVGPGVTAPRSQGAWQAGNSAQVRAASGEGDRAVAARFSVASTGADGLSAAQSAGLQRGARLCPNCQQPEDAHAPGCARIPGQGSDARAVTKAAIPPLA